MVLLCFNLINGFLPMKNKPNNQPQPAPTQLFSAAEANAFSPVLMNVISGIYSNNSTTQTDAFRALIEYFANNHATDEEINFLFYNNGNIVEKLIDDLNQVDPDASEFMARIVGEAIMSLVEGEEDLVITGDNDMEIDTVTDKP